MSAAETAPTNEKTGGEAPGATSYSPAAAWILLLLIVSVTIYVTQMYNRRSWDELCSKRRVAALANESKTEGARRVSDVCSQGGAGRTAEAAITASTAGETGRAWLEPAATPPGAKDRAGYPSTEAALAGEYVAQLYIGTTRDGAETYGDWLVDQHCDLACGLAVAVARSRSKGYAPEHRVLIGPLAAKRDADALCDAFKARGVDCFPKASREALN